MPRLLIASVLAGAVALPLLAAPALAGKKLGRSQSAARHDTCQPGRPQLGNVGGETGYLVERRAYAGGSFAEIGKTTADMTGYTDMLSATDTYEYRMRAYKVGPPMIFSAYTNTVVSKVPCD